MDTGHGGPAEESEDAGSEVPGAVTVDVEEIHPLPEVSAFNSHNPLLGHLTLFTVEMMYYSKEIQVLKCFFFCGSELCRRKRGVPVICIPF